ncbi:MAG: coenzyme F420-0:L-glutamate ligase [Phototrophicaceae bacterium]|jgi:coenzyme F420-0:L-glutamate ligase/coenzyme F420-1:gamma-L-glutamate ligase
MLELISFPVPPARHPAGLIPTLQFILNDEGISPRDGDILALPAQWVAFSQGREQTLNVVVPSQEAIAFAPYLGRSAALTELILQTSDQIIQRDPVLTTINGTVFADAGIQQQGRFVILPPVGTVNVADTVRRGLSDAYGVQLGALISAEVVLLGRKGRGAVALAAAGFEALQDERGKPDLFGNPMKFTVRNWANLMASAAHLFTAKGDHAALIRNSGARMGDVTFSFTDMAIAAEDDLFTWKPPAPRRHDPF